MNLAPVNIDDLNNMPAEGRPQWVGNNIYATIQAACGDDMAPRITGMLIDENVVNFQSLLTDVAYFNTKVTEAYALLAASQQN